MHESYEKVHFDCQCGSEEHSFSFVHCKDDGELYLSVYLNQYRNVFKRIWVAIKYVCGYTSKYGHWDCTIMDDKETKRLLDLCQLSLVERQLNSGPEFPKPVFIEDDVEVGTIADGGPFAWSTVFKGFMGSPTKSTGTKS